MDVKKKLTIRVALYEMVFIVVVDNDVKGTICETRQAQVIKTFLSYSGIGNHFEIDAVWIDPTPVDVVS